jgi:hypothetical protein
VIAVCGIILLVAVVCIENDMRVGVVTETATN